MQKIRNTLGAFAIGLGSICGSDGVEYKPLSVGGLQEIGIIRDGIVGGGEQVSIHNEWVDHFGAFMTQEVSVQNRLTLQVGLGGIFQFPKEEKVEKSIFGSQYKLFYVGPSIAKGTFSVGDVDHPWLKVGVGMFPFKYNSNAVNLGEYLFRSGPYPTYIMTGGFATIDNATAYLQGMHTQANFGNLRFDLLALTETSLPPFYDISIGLLAQYVVMDGLFEIGAGVNLKNLISVDPEKTTPKIDANGYLLYNNFYYSMDQTYYTKPASFWESKRMESQALADTLRNQGDLTGAQAQDVITQTYADQKQVFDDQWAVVEQINFQKDSLEAFIDTSGAPAEVQVASSMLSALPRPNYYTTQGKMLMGRFAFDVKKLFEVSWLGEDDLKLYGEVAVLGWDNYPIFYENREDRIPYTIGFNFPGFKVLDLIAIQYEIFKSSYSNNFLNLADGKATPNLPGGGLKEYSQNDYNDIKSEDNTSWSVLLRKQVYPGLTFSAQIARDHLRTVSTGTFFGARLEPNEVLYRSDYWYWMAQIAWSL